MTATISFVSILIITHLMQIKGMDIPIVIYAGPFCTWIIFFMLGIWLSFHGRKYSLTKPILLLSIGLILSMAESYILSMYSGGGLGIKLSTFIFSIGVILMILSEKCEHMFQKSKYTKPILFLGEISLGVYLMHMYALFSLSLIKQRTGIWIVDWGMVLSITLIMIYLCRVILPKKFVKKYLALA